MHDGVMGKLGRRREREHKQGKRGKERRRRKSWGGLSDGSDLVAEEIGRFEQGWNFPSPTAPYLGLYAIAFEKKNCERWTFACKCQILIVGLVYHLQTNL